MPLIPPGAASAALFCLFAALSGAGAAGVRAFPDSADGGDAGDTLSLPEAQARALPQGLHAFRTVLTPTDEDRLLGNLGDLLQRMAGLHVTRSGGFGDYLGVSLHGSSENQVNVYVNGVLQNQAVDPSLFLSDWDLSRVEKVEVYKGLVPDHLPGSPIGGAINIITRDRVQGAHARMAAGAGSFGSLRASGAAEYRGANWGLHGQAARNQAEGDFTYYDDGGTEYLPGPNGQPKGADDLTRKTRLNNAHGFTETAADAQFQPWDGWDAGVQADLTWLRKEIPTPYANSDDTRPPSAFRTSDKRFMRAFARRSAPGHDLSVDLSGNLLSDAYMDTAVGGGSVGVGYDDDRNDYTDVLATAWDRVDAGNGFSLSTLASYGVSGYRFSDHVAGKRYPWLMRYIGEGKLTPAYTRGNHSLQTVLAAALVLQEYQGSRIYGLGGGFVSQEDWEPHWGLRVAYQYRQSRRLWYSAHAGGAYRIPTFLEKFGDRGSVIGSPDLKSEAAFTAAAGAHLDGARVSAEAEAFGSQGKNFITLEQDSQNILRYVNSGATRIFGLETRGSAQPRPWTRTELDATTQIAVSLGGDGTDEYKMIPYHPLTEASLRQSFLWRGWAFTAAVHYQGLTYPNSANQPSLYDSYSHNTDWQTRSDLRLSWRGRRLLAAAGADNLFDARLFDFFNYPLPGRSFSASLQYEL